MTISQRQPRLMDPGYLAWLRKQPCCCGCGQPPPCDAAHLRAGSIFHSKPITGMGQKPDDKWALPLKHDQHMAQHAFGDEALWWAAHGIDPFELAKQYYAAYGGSGGLPKKRSQKPRPKPRRKAKIPSRPFSTQQRGFRR